MTLAVDDVGEEHSYAGGFTSPQPSVTFAADDIVLLSVQGNHDMTVTLDGEGSMTAVDTLTSDQHAALFAIKCTGSGTSSFTFGGSSPYGAGVAAVVSGASDIPTAVAKNHSYTGVINDAATIAPNAPSGGNCTLYHVFIRDANAGHTVSLAETSVPSDGHDKGNTGPRASAVAADVTNADPGVYTWTISESAGIGAGDVDAVWWTLDFPEDFPNEPLVFSFTRRRRKVNIRELPHQVSIAMVGGIAKNTRK